MAGKKSKRKSNDAKGSSEGGEDIFPGCCKERVGECAAAEADRWANIPRDQKCSHRHKSVPRRHKNKCICTQKKLICLWGLICAQINFSGYTNKCWGHFEMFSGLLANKNKILRYEYAKEQLRTKKLRTHLLCICVSVCDLIKSQSYPAGGGIYHSAGGEKIDFCLCTIPTIGLYGKHGEITATQ